LITFGEPSDWDVKRRASAADIQTGTSSWRTLAATRSWRSGRDDATSRR
jgi:hypothetical protein